MSAPSRPDWLYGQGCCEDWTPLGGCSAGHTGRPAMSLPAREVDGGNGNPDAGVTA